MKISRKVVGIIHLSGKWYFCVIKRKTNCVVMCSQKMEFAPLSYYFYLTYICLECVWHVYPFALGPSIKQWKIYCVYMYMYWKSMTSKHNFIVLIGHWKKCQTDLIILEVSNISKSEFLYDFCLCSQMIFVLILGPIAHFGYY